MLDARCGFGGRGHFAQFTRSEENKSKIETRQFSDVQMQNVNTASMTGAHNPHHMYRFSLLYLYLDAVKGWSTKSIFLSKFENDFTPSSGKDHLFSLPGLQGPLREYQIRDGNISMDMTLFPLHPICSDVEGQWPTNKTTFAPLKLGMITLS
jgi:hypothetical protein